MANNRLYLEDTATGERFFFAKGYGDGWCAVYEEAALHEWLGGRDISGSCGSPTALILTDENEESRGRQAPAEAVAKIRELERAFDSLKSVYDQQADVSGRYIRLLEEEVARLRRALE